MAELTQTGKLTWDAVCNDPQLQDLPYKIELNEWGQIVMSPTRIAHGAYQARIAILLASIVDGGHVITEAAIWTPKGTKVADVAWCSPARWPEIKEALEARVAPEICVEVLSPANVPAEMKQKRRLYFEAGAEEVWLCDEVGRMLFYTPQGAQDRSQLAPAFPKQISL